MFYSLDNEIAKRKNKSIYRDGDKSLKLYIENYSKADILLSYSSCTCYRCHRIL